MDEEGKKPTDESKSLSLREKFKKHREEAKLNKIFTKRYVYVSIVTIIFIGALVPFATQFVFPFAIACGWLEVDKMLFDQCLEAIESWNMFVGIILGIIATITSIISLIISFKNTDDSNMSQQESVMILDEVLSHLRNVEEKQDLIKETLKAKIAPDDSINGKSNADTVSLENAQGDGKVSSEQNQDCNSTEADSSNKSKFTIENSNAESDTSDKF